jgi:hypothetical protein
MRPLGATGALTAGTTALEGLEATLLPTEFAAMAVKVYESPFVRPAKMQVSGPVVQIQL